MESYDTDTQWMVDGDQPETERGALSRDPRDDAQATGLEERVNQCMTRMNGFEQILKRGGADIARCRKIQAVSTGGHRELALGSDQKMWHGYIAGGVGTVSVKHQTLYNHLVSSPSVHDEEQECGGGELATPRSPYVANSYSPCIMRQLSSQVTIEKGSVFKFAGCGDLPAFWGDASGEREQSNMEHHTITTCSLCVSYNLKVESLDELGPHAVSLLKKAIITAVDGAQNEAFTNGTGSGMPEGLYKKLFDGDGVQRKEATTDTLVEKVANAMLECISQLDAAYLVNACFMIPTSLIAVLNQARAHKISSGALLSLNPSRPGMLYFCGFPVYVNANIANTQGRYRIIFGDVRNYQIVTRDKGELTRDPYSVPNAIKFSYRLSVGGQTVNHPT